MSPRFSVVVTAHNEGDAIAACLHAISRQDGVADDELEIVVVDDRSTDDTAGVARACAVEGLRLIRIDEAAATSLTARQNALDLGFRAARGQIVLVLDADALVEPDWLRRMTAQILDGRADAVAGRVRFRGGGALAAWQSVDAAFYLGVCWLLSWLGLDRGVLFGNFCFLRSAYLAVGGFAAIGPTLTEDLAFARSLARTGCRIAYDDPTVSVRAAPDWQSLIARAKRVGSGPVAPLSVALAAWMALLPIFAIAALASGSAALWAAFAVRYLAGAAFVAANLLAGGLRRLLPLALFYEPLAIAIGLWVIVAVALDPRVTWGGRVYRQPGKDPVKAP
ncbi:glycosyltransferase [Nitratireductor sp. CAU 1489]|uniref:Glycosyltransferase n=1 Tax=Nitratireductor arenosus TaxID=2682096 RepID=A0A844QFM7_9HYPH|nr:glycosyltransferase [Nitratireductor arenosus]MVA96820.1 glycosyltransferase [Nitratireductor arenosus]